MSKLREAWNKLKESAGIRECAVCEQVLDEIIVKHSQEQTGLDLCYKHLKMYRGGEIDWSGDRYVEQKRGK